MQKLKLLIYFFSVFSFTLAGVTGKISGRIIDKESGEPLIGANVIVEGTSLGASTDYEGKNQIENIYYTISLIDSKNSSEKIDTLIKTHIHKTDQTSPLLLPACTQ